MYFHLETEKLVFQVIFQLTMTQYYLLNKDFFMATFHFNYNFNLQSKNKEWSKSAYLDAFAFNRKLQIYKKEKKTS